MFDLDFYGHFNDKNSYQTNVLCSYAIAYISNQQSTNKFISTASYLMIHNTRKENWSRPDADISYIFHEKYKHKGNVSYETEYFSIQAVYMRSCSNYYEIIHLRQWRN